MLSGKGEELVKYRQKVRELASDIEADNDFEVMISPLLRNQDLSDAEYSYDDRRYLAANNRTYYSIFHAIRAVLALERIDFRKHQISAKEIDEIMEKRYKKLIKRRDELDNGELL